MVSGVRGEGLGQGILGISGLRKIVDKIHQDTSLMYPSPLVPNCKCIVNFDGDAMSKMPKFNSGNDPSCSLIVAWIYVLHVCPDFDKYGYGGSIARHLILDSMI